MFKWIATGAALLALGGCTSGVDKDIQFGPDSSKALVVIGVVGLDQWQDNAFGMIFRGVDGAGAMDSRAFTVSNGSGWKTMNPVEYFVIEAEPGPYVIAETDTVLGIRQEFTRYCQGTWKFELPRGKAVYIGDFVAAKDGVAVPALPHPEAATAKLTQYPHVAQSLTQAKLQRVAYPASRFCD
jgi:hypothetical protein